MKRIYRVLIVLILGTISYGFVNQANVNSDFCEGWEDGYQDALEGCFKVGLTPLCPIPPIGRDTYKHGYGMGYSRGELKCLN